MNSLHERYVTVTTADGHEERVSALDASRTKNVEFVEFRPAPVDGSDQAAVDAWMDRANYIVEDLRWLLKLPYDRYFRWQWLQYGYPYSKRSQVWVDGNGDETLRPQDLVHYIRYWTRWQSRDEKLNFLKSAAILKIAFLAITQKPIVRFQRNFVWGSRMACRQGLHDKNCKFSKSKMADGRHFENRKIAISQ